MIAPLAFLAALLRIRPRSRRIRMQASLPSLCGNGVSRIGRQPALSKLGKPCRCSTSPSRIAQHFPLGSRRSHTRNSSSYVLDSAAIESRAPRWYARHQHRPLHYDCLPDGLRRPFRGASARRDRRACLANSWRNSVRLLRSNWRIRAACMPPSPHDWPLAKYSAKACPRCGSSRPSRPTARAPAGRIADQGRLE